MLYSQISCKLRFKKKKRKKNISANYLSTIWLKQELFCSTVRDQRHESSFILINTDMVHRIIAESSQPEFTIGQRNLTSRAGILWCLRPRQDRNIIHTQINHCHSQSCLLRKGVNELTRGLSLNGPLQRSHM